MFVKITNGVVDQYPYTVGQLRRDNPNTSFPKVIPPEVLADFGVFEVAYQAAPEYDQKTQRIETSAQPVLVDGSWTLTKTVVNKTQEQIDADISSKSDAVRSERNKLIESCDWTQLPDAPVDKTAWATYRQELRDITKQAGFPWEVTWPTMPE